MTELRYCDFKRPTGRPRGSGGRYSEPGTTDGAANVRRYKRARARALRALSWAHRDTYEAFFAEALAEVEREDAS